MCTTEKRRMRSEGERDSKYVIQQAFTVNNSSVLENNLVSPYFPPSSSFHTSSSPCLTHTYRLTGAMCLPLPPSLHLPLSLSLWSRNISGWKHIHPKATPHLSACHQGLTEPTLCQTSTRTRTRSKVQRSSSCYNNTVGIKICLPFFVWSYKTGKIMQPCSSRVHLGFQHLKRFYLNNC